jgi:hypothetical protein
VRYAIVLVEPQHIRGVVLFLDLHQASVVRPVSRPDRSSLVSPSWLTYTPCAKGCKLARRALTQRTALAFSDGVLQRAIKSTS